MEAEVDAPLERDELGLVLAELAADALDGALEPHALGLELGGAHALRGGDGREQRRALGRRRRHARDHHLRAVVVRLLLRGRGAVLDGAGELLDARLVVAEVVLELVALLLERLDAHEVVLAGLVGFDLGLELLHDHHRAPRALLLGAQDVAVDVVADVQDLLAHGAQLSLEPVGIAALESLRQPFQRLGQGLVHEEGGLPRAHHHEVEVVLPAGPGRVHAVQQVGEDAVSETPLAVADHEQLLAGPLPAVEGPGQFRIAEDEELPVLQHFGLHLAEPVGGVDGPAHIEEHLQIAAARGAQDRGSRPGGRTGNSR